MEVLDADPAIDMVFGHVTEFVSPDVDEDALALLRPPVPRRAGAATNLMLIRRSSYDKVGPFSEDLRAAVGVDWYARGRRGLREAVPQMVVLERRLTPPTTGFASATPGISTCTC